ncbi:MAG: leucine-rich repeat domain-containing protein [Zhaonellaceae bacterium]
MDLSGDLPSGLTYLGSDVFQETDITSITIPNGITEIKEDTFYACHNLTSIEFAGNIISIGKNGIRETAITNLVIPGSLTSIGDYALRDNTDLITVEFEGTIEEWNSVTKGSGYKLNVPATEITCTDGTATF